MSELHDQGPNQSVLIDVEFPDTLDSIATGLLATPPAEGLVEIWAFAAAERRRNVERHLAGNGIEARIRSAYKPLVHAFDEEIDTAGLVAATIHYPIDDRAAEGRFLTEAYPLGAMLHPAKLHFIPYRSNELTYRITLDYAGGRQIEHTVFAPNRLRRDHLDLDVLCPCGWLKRHQAGALEEVAIPTEHEQLFEKVISTIQQVEWGASEPYFERMEISAAIAGFETDLAGTDEQLSTFEALHEDIYFSLLEFFQRHSGKPIGDRTLQPGQIVPLLRPIERGAHLRIVLTPFPVVAPPQPEKVTPLEASAASLSAQQIEREFAALPGARVQGRSRQGRAVQGLYHPGSGPAMLLTAGQHANEPTGIVGALRAAQLIGHLPDTHYAFIALENPDGHDLHRELMEQHPRHMHHAARYTALGDDLEYRVTKPLYEQTVRNELNRLAKPVLHVNLHGYPAHEWTRPFTGYIPRHFDHWSVPKGFFLVVRFREGYRELAESLLKAVTADIAQVPGLVDFNRKQRAAFETHVLLKPYEVLDDVPYILREANASLCPVTLITEFPDETIYGDAFRLGHEVQLQTVLAAVKFLKSTVE